MSDVFEKLAAALDASVENGPGLGPDEVAHFELPSGVVVGLSAPGKVTSLVSIAARHKGRLPSLTIRPEQALDRLGKRLGLNREVQLGDSSFDDAHYLESDAGDDAVKGALEKASVRGGIRSLLSAGAGQVRLVDGAVMAMVLASDQRLDAKLLSALADGVSALASALPDLRGTDVSDRPVTAPLVLKVCAVLAAAGGLIALFAPFDMATGNGPASYDQYRSVVRMCVGLGAFSLLPLWVVLRGRSTAVRSFVPSAACGWFAATWITATALLWANADLDKSPGQGVELTIVGKHTERPRKATEHFVVVEPFGDKPRERLHVSAGFFARVSPGTVIKAKLHPGALGWAWLSEMK